MLSRSVKNKYGNYVPDATVIEWLDATLGKLEPWAKAQVKFLSPASWLKDSKKLCENEKYEHLLMLMVDGTILNTLDTNDS